MEKKSDRGGNIDLHITNSWEIKENLRVAGILTRHAGTAGNNSSIYPMKNSINKANVLIY